jgi:hypothetical protein
VAPLVLIEISPPDQPAELSRALVDACSSTVREGKCGLASDADAPAAAALAIVRWTDQDELEALVQVGVRKGTATNWQARTLRFVDTDLRVERWRSVGLTIATLVGETAKSKQDSVSREKRRRPDPAAAAPPRAAASPPKPGSEDSSQRIEVHQIWVNLGATVGPGLGEGDLRLGGRIEAGWRPSRLPLILGPWVGYAVRLPDDQGVSARWLNAGITLGWTFELHSRWNIEPRVGARVEVMEAAVDSPSSRKDSGRHTAYGGDIGLQLVLRLGRLCPFAEVQGYYHDRGTDVTVAGQAAGTASAAGLTSGLGVRVFLD